MQLSNNVTFTVEIAVEVVIRDSPFLPTGYCEVYLIMVQQPCSPIVDLYCIQVLMKGVIDFSEQIQNIKTLCILGGYLTYKVVMIIVQKKHAITVAMFFNVMFSCNCDLKAQDHSNDMKFVKYIIGLFVCFHFLQYSLLENMVYACLPLMHLT